MIVADGRFWEGGGASRAKGHDPRCQEPSTHGGGFWRGCSWRKQGINVLCSGVVGEAAVEEFCVFSQEVVEIENLSIMQPAVHEVA